MAENNNVVAKLCSDGSIWPIDHTSTTIGELASLVNYKIRTEGDIVNKHKLSTTSVPTAVVDLGKQLLLYAKDSDLTGVRTMLARGAPFTSDWLGMSALHFAAMNNQYEICDVLIQGGMNKDIKTKVDRTPLHFATYYGHERIVKMLLINNCAVNPKDMLRMTPLHWAIERRHKNIVRMLLKYSADVNVVTKFNKTPIGIAVLTEQPDILAELQVAKAEQAKKLFNEEQEKEISDAVGTILPEVSNQTDTKFHMDYMEVDDNNTDPQITNFERIKETGILDKNAINLLKSHGISMMQEEDEDGSKDLLSTALQNGRQLVLSEGGKMLLNETRQQKFIKHNSNLNTNTNTTINNAAVQQKNSNNKQNITVPRQQDSVAKNNVRIVSYKEFQNMFYNSSDGKPVEKSTPTMSNMRIIRQQQNDSAINLSSTTSSKNTMVVGNAASVRSSMMTTRSIHQSQQHRQMKITPMKATAAIVTTTPATKSGIVVTTTGPSGKHIIKESNDLSDIIQILPNDNKNDNTEINQCKNVQSRLALPNTNTTTVTTTTTTTNNVRSTVNANSSTNSKLNTNTNTNTDQMCTPTNPNNSNVPVCFIQTRRGLAETSRQATATTTTTTHSINSATSTVRQINVMKRPHQPSQQSQNQNQSPQSKVPATTTNSKSNSSSGQTLKPAPNVMPLLSTPEICRQLYEMRKQNEDLRRRVDMLQKEKEEMRQRLDRLEELLLVERADEEAYEIES